METPERQYDHSKPEKSTPGNVSVLCYHWDDELGSSVKKAKVDLDPEDRRTSITTSYRLRLKIIDLINNLDTEARNLRKKENKNTKCEIKSSSEKIASTLSQLTTRRVMDNLEEKGEGQEIIMVNDTVEQASQTEGVDLFRNNCNKCEDVATQTEGTPWSTNSGVEIKNLQAQIASKRGYEGWKSLEVKAWPPETFKVVKEANGNPIWDNEEKDLAVLLEENDTMDGGITRQLKRRFPEIEYLRDTQAEEGCSCLIYEPRILSSSAGEGPGRRTITRISVGKDDMIDYMNLIKWKEKATEMGLNRVATVITGEGWAVKKKMIEHAFWGTGINIIVYSPRIRPRGRELKPKNSGNPETMVSAKKTKQRTHEAVVVKDSKKSYAELLKAVKEKINIDELGIKIRGARSTRKGDLLLTLDKQGNSADKLKEAIDKELGKDGVETRMGGQTNSVLHIKGIDCTITEEDLRGTIARITGTAERLTEVKSIRPAYGRRLNATILTDKAVAENLLRKGVIQIGWSICQVQERVTVRRCLRCWGFDHTRRECRGEDRSTKCLRCAAEGHKASECGNDPYCPICVASGHRADSMSCPVYRKEAEARADTVSRARKAKEMEDMPMEMDQGIRTSGSKQEQTTYDSRADPGSQKEAVPND